MKDSVNISILVPTLLGSLLLVVSGVAAWFGWRTMKQRRKFKNNSYELVEDKHSSAERFVTVNIHYNPSDKLLWLMIQLYH